MISKFKIKNFKCFDELEIDNLGKVNILLGDNNVGKTTLLEAIFGYACGKNITPLLENTILRLARNRDQNLYSLVEKVLNTFNDKNNLEFSLEGTLNKNEIVKCNYKIMPSSVFGEINSNLIKNNSIMFENKIQNNVNAGINQIQQRFFFNIIFNQNDEIVEKSVNFPVISELSNESPFINGNIIYAGTDKSGTVANKIYSILKRNNEEFEQFIGQLNKAFKNSIEMIDMFPYPDGTPSPVSIKSKGKEFMPIYEYGEGMQKWVFIVGSLMIYRNYIHCIEEIGDMLHPEAQGILGLNISEMAEKYNNQIFATTQSLEFVQNYLKTVSKENENLLKDIRIITLKNIDGKIRTRVLEGEKALDLLMNNKMELR
jgi:AAA15 family ATPase/GTPase